MEYTFYLLKKRVLKNVMTKRKPTEDNQLLMFTMQCPDNKMDVFMAFIFILDTVTAC